ncbi:hypothetical protein [Methylobacterium nigriterrae]|uniref:hypothetical protein n=1 Tax=Methylobacterium nigriterrae TaxID=3127512 RepID=UPI003013C8F4
MSTVLARSVSVGTDKHHLSERRSFGSRSGIVIVTGTQVRKTSAGDADGLGLASGATAAKR